MGNVDVNGWFQNYKMEKCYKKLENLAIDPSNKKLRHFQILCCVTLYVDLFFTSLIIANHQFIVSKEESECCHKSLLKYINKKKNQ